MDERQTWADAVIANGNNFYTFVLFFPAIATSKMDIFNFGISFNFVFKQPKRIALMCDEISLAKITTKPHLEILSRAAFTGIYELNKLTSLPMCGFVAQLVEHRTGIPGGHGFESR